MAQGPAVVGHGDLVAWGSGGMETQWHRDLVAQGQVGMGTCRHGERGPTSPPWAPPLSARPPQPGAPQGDSATEPPTLAIPAKNGLQGVGHVLVPLAQRLRPQ